MEPDSEETRMSFEEGGRRRDLWREWTRVGTAMADVAGGFVSGWVGRKGWEGGQERRGTNYTSLFPRPISGQ